MAMEWARMAWGAAYVQPGFTIAVVSLFAVGLANQGHGVAIVAGIVDAHGGSVHVEQADGGGAQFTVELAALDTDA